LENNSNVVKSSPGFIWLAFDKRKQGWYDRLAGAVVIRNNQPEPAKFENKV
jgi:uncharacterized RDD family membrane protein YckC